MTGDLVERLRAELDRHEAWARAASRPYPYADEGSKAPEGGVHWRWVAGENWETTDPDPAVDEFVGGEPGAPVNLATVEEWPSTSRDSDGTVLRAWSMPLTYANEVVEMDAAAAGLIQRYDPAHVLRTIQAHRRILERHSNPEYMCPRVDEEGVYFDWAGGGESLCDDVRDVASIYFPEGTEPT